MAQGIDLFIPISIMNIIIISIFDYFGIITIIIYYLYIF